MKLYCAGEKEAKSKADALYTGLQKNNPAYANNMERWDIAHQDKDGWFINVDAGIESELSLEDKSVLGLESAP